MRLTSALCKRFNVLNLVGEETKRYSNLPDSYIKRAMEQVYYKTPKGLQYWPGKTLERRSFKFTTHRPWTMEFRLENPPGKRPNTPLVEPIREWSFFRGDRVEILVGPDKGKQGIVKEIYQERNWITVEGLNTTIELFGKSKKFPGIWIRKEHPLLVTTDIKLVDPGDLKLTDIEWRYTEGGERVRVSKRTGRIIPIPVAAHETYDYKMKASYKDKPKDTHPDEVAKVTFEPKLQTFEMDIMKQMNIEEERTPHKTYWY